MLTAHKDIYPRPTPWKVCWAAWLQFLVGRKTYQFVYIPQKFDGLDGYTIKTEDGDLLLHEGDTVVYTSPLHDMNWRLWWVYVFESWAFGLFFSFWNWRWEGGTLTRKELAARLERLERQMDTRTRRIVEDDDE